MRITLKILLLIAVLLMPFTIFSQTLQETLIQDLFSSHEHSFADRINSAIPTFPGGPDILMTRNDEDLYFLDSVRSFTAVSVNQYDELNRHASTETYRLSDYTRLTYYSIHYLDDTNLVDSTMRIGYETDGLTIFSQSFSTFSYNDNQLIDTIFKQFATTNGDNSNTFTVFDYNSEDAVVSVKREYFDDYGIARVNRLTEVEYDSIGRLLLENEFSMGTESGQFGLYSVSKYDYDSINNFVVNTIDFTHPQFLTAVMEYEISENEDIVSIRYRSPHMNQSEQIVGYEFNTAITSEYFIWPSSLQPLPDFQYHYKRPSQLTSVAITSVGIGGDIGETRVSDYFWSKRDVTTSVKDAIDTNIEVYPNPVKDFLSLQFDENTVDLDLEVYDMNGRSRLVVENGLHYNQGVDVSILEQGVYFFTLSDGNQILYSGKFIKN